MTRAKKNSFIPGSKPSTSVSCYVHFLLLSLYTAQFYPLSFSPFFPFPSLPFFQIFSLSLRFIFFFFFCPYIYTAQFYPLSFSPFFPFPSFPFLSFKSFPSPYVSFSFSSSFLPGKFENFGYKPWYHPYHTT